MPAAVKTVLALDVGDRRVGIARASSVARLASPLITLTRTDTFINELQKLIDAEDAVALVVGMPRGLHGQTTAQSRATLVLVKNLRSRLAVPIYLQDEAVTSKRAESELVAHGKAFTKEDIDALAATYILEDWLQAHPEVSDA